MPIQPEQARELLLNRLNDEQRRAVSSTDRRLIVIAGAGSGKTEVMARRVAWWVAVDGVERDQIVAFTFTEKAAEELKFRIRSWLQTISGDENNDTSLGGMFIGTIHASAPRREVITRQQQIGIIQVEDPDTANGQRDKSQEDP